MRRVIGLMSGTSADGVDAAVIEAAGVTPDLQVRLLAHHAAPYPAALRDRIRRASDARTGTVDEVTRLHFELAGVFADAALAAVSAAGLAASDIACIGSHGQTLHHLPPGPPPGGASRGSPVRRIGPDAVPAPGPGGATLQVAHPSVIALRTGIPVVADFRAADIAVGGQGAPLVPFTDWVLLRSATVPRVVLNLGGVANFTWLPAGGGAESVVAGDTGPANALMDAAVRMLFDGGPGGCGYDRDGVLAAAGTVDEGALSRWLSDPWFGLPVPKSTGPERFGPAWLERELADHPEWRSPQRGSGRDLMAGLAALTVRSVAGALARSLPAARDGELILCGGGARNPVLRAGLAAATGMRVRTTADFGIPDTAKEAVSFAVLALAFLDGVPANLPGATGAGRRVRLGVLCPAGSGEVVGLTGER